MVPYAGSIWPGNSRSGPSRGITGHQGSHRSEPVTLRFDSATGYHYEQLGEPMLDRLVGAERRLNHKAPEESPPVRQTTCLTLRRQAVGNETGEMTPTATTASGP